MKRITTTLVSTIIAVLLVLSFGLFGPGILAQGNRLALVVGNAAYKSSPLRNPVNDAHDITRTLNQLGFEVIHKENANQRTMENAISRFGRQLRKQGGVGLFYFAGHGIQVKGRNYLIPVDAKIETESDVRFEAVDAGRVLGKMEDAGNDLNIVILDACRDNPFARSFRTSSKGLARMDAPKGSLIAYATAPGSVAADGEGRNGIYTKYLLKHMATLGSKVEEVLKRVRVDVINETNEKQIPWEASSLTGEFYFAPKRGIAVVKRPPVEPQRPERDEGLEKEREQLERERQELERLKIEIERKKLEAERKRLEAEKENLAMSKRPPKAESKRTFTNSIGMKFVLIPEGTFMMGSPSDEPGRLDREKQHRVTLSKGFYIQTTEVTQGQWREIMGTRPWSGKKYVRDNVDCPAVYISWNDCKDFIRRLNQKEGTNKYRLPTEAEWEYACRAGSTKRFYFGNSESIVGDYAWYRSNANDAGEEYAHSAGSKKPNPWGLYDMHGNVWEWCQDWYEKNYLPGHVTDPKGPSSGTDRVFRGGGWDDYARFCRSANRFRSRPGYRYGGMGFRVARAF